MFYKLLFTFPNQKKVTNLRIYDVICSCCAALLLFIAFLFLWNFTSNHCICYTWNGSHYYCASPQMGWKQRNLTHSYCLSCKHCSSFCICAVWWCEFVWVICPGHGSKMFNIRGGNGISLEHTISGFILVFVVENCIKTKYVKKNNTSWSENREGRVQWSCLLKSLMLQLAWFPHVV